MRIDLYTKIILTIIAACLAWLTISGRTIAPVVEAQEPQRVVIAGWQDQAGFIYRLPGLPEAFRQRPQAIPVRQQ